MRPYRHGRWILYVRDHQVEEMTMQEVVEYLCSPECLPRNPGTSGGLAARAYLKNRLEELGLEPIGERGFEQAIPSIGASNLLARIPGRGDRCVLIGAHYDACGVDNPGADDNAAAVAITLEVASQLQARDLDRSVIIALFDAEEPPYFLSPVMGSQWFVDNPTLPLDSIDMMICLDLVGHALGPAGLPAEVRDSVFVLGAEKSTDTGALFDSLPDQPGIRPRRIDNYIIESKSDYDAFMHAGIPFLFYTVGRSEHYHMPTDTPDRLDYNKMVALADHLTDLVTALANRTDKAVFVTEGFDDEATIASLESLLTPLAPLSDAAQMASMVVSGLRGSLDTNGELTHAERDTVRMLVEQVEMALS